jgi:hypothetical protein
MRPRTPTRHHDSGQREILARQGLRLPAITLKRLQSAGIYCQPTVSIEHQHLARMYVLRGVESGGAVADLGAYSSFVAEDGNALPWLQRVDSIGVNGVHAIVITPVLVRVEMIRIERTYDLLITRHSLTGSEPGRRPRLESSILFYGRRGSLGMELWGEDTEFRGAVCPVFYSRSGEALEVPSAFRWAAAKLTAGVCCVGCRHCHVLQANSAPKSTSYSSHQSGTDIPLRSTAVEEPVSDMK